VTGAGERPAGLSRGFLPRSALQKLEPTSVASLDLEGSLSLLTPEGQPPPPGRRDCLLLVRLHEDPLAVVHLEKDPAAVQPAELAAGVWRLAGKEIRRHAKRFNCLEAVPERADDLLDGVRSKTGNCPGAKRIGRAGLGAVILSTTGGDPPQLRRCLNSLTKQQCENFEVVVVDNRPGRGDTRAIVEEVSDGRPRVRYVPEQRAGLSVARNRGLTETDAELVAFTDDDVVVDPLWLDWLLDPFSDPSVTASCGMVLPFELETEAQKRFELYLGFSRGVQRREHDLQTGLAAGVPFYPFLADIFGSGNSMAFRREELRETGGFDPALGAGSPTHAGEETDAFSRTVLRGGRIIYQPRALSWHQHRRDNEALQTQIFGYGVGVGALITKALTHDRRFYRAAAAQVLSLASGAIFPSAGGGWPLDATGADDRSGELLRARRAGIAQGPYRYLQGMARARRLGLRRMGPSP